MVLEFCWCDFGVVNTTLYFIFSYLFTNLYTLRSKVCLVYLVLWLFEYANVFPFTCFSEHVPSICVLHFHQKNSTTNKITIIMTVMIMHIIIILYWVVSLGLVLAPLACKRDLHRVVIHVVRLHSQSDSHVNVSPFQTACYMLYL